jgi:hypothetical protein
VRHLSIDQARAALRRGAAIEQLLNRSETDGRPALRWLSLIPSKAGDIEMRFHSVFDVGTDEFADVTEFPPTEADESIGEGRPMGHYREPEHALREARMEWGAVDDRWVNSGLVGEEYADQRS